MFKHRFFAFNVGKKSKKEKTHQPSRSSEGCKGVDAEHNDMRRREKKGKHRESKKGHLKALSCCISLLLLFFPFEDYIL